MTQFSNKFKKPCFWPIFPIFGAKKVSLENPAPSRTTSYESLATCPKWWLTPLLQDLMWARGEEAHFNVAIPNQKGVLCEQYDSKINAGMFSDFIKTHFQETFSQCRIPKDKRFLQDGCRTKQ